MKVVVTFLSFLIPFWLYANSLFSFIENVINIYNKAEEDTKKFAESEQYLQSEEYKYLRWVHSEQPRLNRQLNRSLYEYYESCPGCPDVLPLTETVNEIVQKLAEQEDKTNPQAHLVEKVGSLELILNVVKDLSRPLEGGGCYTESRCANGKVSPIINESTVLIFSSPIDQEKLRGITIIDGKKKEYYYRASLDNYSDEVIIHLIIDEFGNSLIEYYTQRQHTLETNEQAPPPPPPNQGISKRPNSAYGPWLSFKSSPKSKISLEGHLALAILLPSNAIIPEHFYLANIEAKINKTSVDLKMDSTESSFIIRNEFDEDFTLITGASTDYQSFTTSMGVADRFVLDISTDMSFKEYTAGLNLPTQITAGPLDLNGTTSLEHTIGSSEIDIKTNYVVRFDNNPNLTFSAKTETSINNDSDDNNVIINSINLGSNINLSEDSSVSLIFDYQYQENPTMTFTYKISK